MITQIATVISTFNQKKYWINGTVIDKGKITKNRLKWSHISDISPLSMSVINITCSSVYGAFIDLNLWTIKYFDEII